MSSRDAAAVSPDLIDFCERSVVALSLASPDGDLPLTFVNRRFSDLTGYSGAESVGKNCRFLQGDADNTEARATLYDFLKHSDSPSISTTMVNFKQDGTPFVNLLYLSRLTSSAGTTQFFLASQFDMSRTFPDKLAAYDAALGATLSQLKPLMTGFGMFVEDSLKRAADSITTIAQARLTLARLIAR